MLLRTLGSAAGGGFPQWNCACHNCIGVRAGTLPAKSRSQSQLAVSADGRSWYLLGASPDLRAQIEATPALHPHHGVRQSPIAGIVLASADLDHVLGLLFLRELQPLRVYATPSTQRILREDNTAFRMLNRVEPQVEWTDFLPGNSFPLSSVGGDESGLRIEAISLGEHYPAYVSPERSAALVAGEASLGLILTSHGKAAGYFPAVPRMDDELLAKLDTLDLLFFDGTFWSDDELIRVQGAGQTSLQMGHTPVSSAGGSLDRLAALRKPRKIFVHINNTNPMLDESSVEHRQVHDAGWEIAEDGWQFEL
jgi:pyrroloquinoline quinone biosynthesis protein B